MSSIKLNEQAIAKLSKFLKDCHINYSQVLLRQAVDDVISQYEYVNQLSNTETATEASWYDITPAESKTGEKVSIHLTKDDFCFRKESESVD